jgi:hypothetical protein
LAYSWAEFAGVFCRTRAAYLDHDAAKAELRKLMPEDAKEAIGHGIRAKRSKSGAIILISMRGRPPMQRPRCELSGGCPFGPDRGS